MKNIKILFSVILLSAIFFSCSKDDDSITIVPDPTADFSVEFAENNPQLVSFINNSENAKEYFWDFGDGSDVSTQKHPTHRYESAGKYTIKLTAIANEASTETLQGITVVGAPTAYFSYVADEENSLIIHFENQSQNVNQFSWDFGDGTGTSTEENPSYTYSETGTYTVSLIATGEGGTMETSLEVKVKPAQPAFDQLYIIGDGSPSGWNIGSPETFIQSQDNPFLFIYEGLLTPGNIKFSTFTGDWCDAEWLNAPEAGLSATGTTGYIVTQGCDGPDNQWIVTEETQGRYRITVNMEDDVVSFEPLLAPYSELYAIGDATPNGWIPQTPEEAFMQDSGDSFVFTYEAYLSPGEIKISTFTGEWCDGEWLNASEANQPVAEAQYIVTNGCDGPDNKWIVTQETEGTYLIKVDLYNQTINFQKQ